MSSNPGLDVAIIGGGLAGLTLARQVRNAAPEMKIAVFERTSLPPPRSAHKVGEATVEIGAHYLAHSLGLETLLERTQLRKFGLRLFFGSGFQRDLAQADELGSSKFLPAISYQLDRGVLERDLAGLLARQDVEVHDRSPVKAVSIPGKGQARLRVAGEGGAGEIEARWVVDASARASVLKRTLGLRAPVRHKTCAAWFRLDASIDVDDLSGSTSWKARCGGLMRRLSTNHLMGPGYWIWIIPLAGDRTSVGLVADPDAHPPRDYDTFPKLLRWLEDRQPLLAERIHEARASLMDFRRLQRLAMDSSGFWSELGWALTGEAGAFTDPLYSPGTDFIGISNTFVTDLIARRCPDAERKVRAEIYQRLYRSFIDSAMSLYTEQYAGFGETRFMTVKSTWDYAYYWSVLAWLFFRGVMTDLPFLRSAQPELTRLADLNRRMQAEFRRRAAAGRQDRGSGRFIDQSRIPILAASNGALLEGGADLRQELLDNGARLDAVAPRLLALLEEPASGTHPGCDLLGDLGSRLAG